MTALLYACEGGHFAIVQWLVREAGSDAQSERCRVRLCAIDVACADCDGVMVRFRAGLRPF